MNGEQSVMELVRDLVDLTDLKQKDVANQMGLKASQMNLYFNGHSEMRANRLVELLDILGINVQAEIQKRIRALKEERSVAHLDQFALAVKLGSVDQSTRKSLKSLIEQLGA